MSSLGFVEDAIIHCSTYVAEYSLSTIYMDIARCLHELDKEADRIIEVELCNGEVD